MDVSGFILIPLSALITASWLIGAALLSESNPRLKLPFLLSFTLGVLFMEPWLVTSWPQAGYFAFQLVLVGVWTAFGWLFGGLAAAILTGVAAKLLRRTKK